ncbi:MAG TPA: hypothetical protein DDZ89_21300 [Clostridiales bacterium]|nr:hypothetical protein [Clostridiales bacterium]
MIKKTCALLLPVVLLLASVLLSGCHTGNQAPDEYGGFTNPLDTNNSLSDIQNTEITYIYTPTPTIDLQFNAHFNEVVAEMEKLMLDKHRIKVNLEFLPNHNYYDTVKKRLHSNDSIDAFSPHPSEYPNSETVPYNKQNYLQQWINEFEIADLTELINGIYPELNKSLLDPDVKEAVLYNGRVYGVPGTATYMLGNLQVLIVYKEYYESIGKPEIHTIDDLYHLIDSVKDSPYNDKGRILCGFDNFLSWHCGNNGYVYYMNLLAYKGKTLLPLENEPVFHEAFHLYKDISDLVSEDNSYTYWRKNVDVPGINDIIAYGDSFFSPILIQLSTYNHILTKGISDTERFLDEYEFLFLNNPSTVTYDIYSLNYLINGASPHINTALFFIKCLQTDEQLYDLFRYGIKDKHYSLNEQGAVSFSTVVFTGWDHSGRLISRNLERPMIFEQSTSGVWEYYIQKPKNIIDGINYKKLLRLHLDHEDIDQDLSRIFNNRNPYFLLKEVPEVEGARTLTDVVQLDIEIEDFIRLYYSHETDVLIKSFQDIIDEYVQDN